MSNYIMERYSYLKIIKDTYINLIIDQIKNNPVIIREQCDIFRQNQLACSVAGDFNNCMLIRLNINKSELKSLTKQCRQ